MPREETEQALILKFKKTYGRAPSVLELQQFNKNRPHTNYDDERETISKDQEDDDHPFLRNTRSQFSRRRSKSNS
jgi:hypothetical protein